MKLQHTSCHAVLAGLLMLIMGAVQVHAQPVLEDDFSGTTINAANWAVHADQGSVTQNGALVFDNGNSSWDKTYVTSVASFARAAGGRALRVSFEMKSPAAAGKAFGFFGFYPAGKFQSWGASTPCGMHNGGGDLYFIGAGGLPAASHIAGVFTPDEYKGVRITLGPLRGALYEYNDGYGWQVGRCTLDQAGEDASPAYQLYFMASTVAPEKLCVRAVKVEYANPPSPPTPTPTPISIDFSAHGQPWLNKIAARVETRTDNFNLSDPRYQLSESTQPAGDAFGNDPWRVIAARDRRGMMDLRLSVRQNARGDALVKLWCKNRTAKPQYIRNFVVVDGFRPGAWEGGSALSFGAFEGVSPLKKDVQVGGPYATAANRPAFSGGFVATSHYRGLVNLLPVEGGLRVTAIDQGEEVRLPAGVARESEPVWLSAGAHPSEELERFGDLAGKWNHCHIFPKTFATWCSWYSGLNDYRIKEKSDILERFAHANMPGLSERYLPLGLECMRVHNDTRHRVPGDWTFVTRQLPHGIPAMNRDLRKYGFRPGGYMDLCDIVVASNLYKKHPDWLVRGADGKPIIIPDDTYMGDFGHVDTSVDAARDYVEQAGRRYREAGFRYCFWDWSACAAVPPSVSHKPEMTGVEVARRAYEAVRKGFGKDFFFLGQVMDAGFMGVMDAVRSGDDGWGHTMITYTQALSKWFLNRRVVIHDPDAWTPQLQDYEWVRDWGTWEALMGYSMTLGMHTAKVPDGGPCLDQCVDMTPERDMLIKRILPPLSTPGRPRDIWEREDSPMVIEQQLSAGGEAWRVVGLFNYRPVPKHARLNLDRLWDESKFDAQGFPGNPARLGGTSRRYLVYDFWPEKFLGERGGVAEFDLEAMRGKVIVVREAAPRPQLLAVGNHLGQGVEELKKSAWNDKTKTLTLTTQGRRGMFNTDVRLRVPADWQVVSAMAGKKKLPWTSPQADVCLLTMPDRKQAVTCKIKFTSPRPLSPPRPLCPTAYSRPVEPGLIAELTLDPATGKKVREGLDASWKKQLAARLTKDLPAGKRTSSP